VNDRLPPRDARRIHIPAPGDPGGGSPPSRPAPAPGPPPDRPPRRSAPAVAPRDRGDRRAPARAPAPVTRRGKRRRFLPHRPKLRRVLLLLPILLPLLLLVAALGSYLYAKGVYDKIEKVELSDVLASGGDGTNYLIVGSDSRDPQAIIDAGLNPDAFGDDGSQRSDTMLLLRLQGRHSQLLSIPRDLYVTLAETGQKGKINAAYNGGPRRLVLTLQEALGLPVHHYLEIDFVSFASLVDALGGITIDFPNPAFDRNSGLDVQSAGPAHLDGPQALAYVRSRHYTEVIDGKQKVEPTGDLGRIKRQQAFLSAVFGKLGDSRNPISLARAANGASDGLRIDDTLGFADAARLAWKLRSLALEPVELPVKNGRNGSGAVLFLQQPEADAVLAGFR
jgi:LCP family protein required for cell wall assembly